MAGPRDPAKVASYPGLEKLGRKGVKEPPRWLGKLMILVVLC